jgi:hypothetical protein
MALSLFQLGRGERKIPNHYRMRLLGGVARSRGSRTRLLGKGDFESRSSMRRRRTGRSTWYPSGTWLVVCECRSGVSVTLEGGGGEEDCDSR